MPRLGYDAAREAASAVLERLHSAPRVALVLGSGLGPLAGEIEDAVVVPYGSIPHFPASTAPGHRGSLVIGRLAGTAVVAMSGRVHLYEGYGVDEVVLPIRTMRLLGVEVAIVTNAAGGVNDSFHSGALMLIRDHINLTGDNPLVGPNDERFGVRFPDMTEAYAPNLRALAHRVANSENIAVTEGVYLGLRGPNYETPAEVRMARLLGADAVGMSTVLEVIAARHMDMQILGISCITNMAAGILPQKLTQEEVIDTAHRVYGEFSSLVRGIVAELQ